MSPERKAEIVEAIVRQFEATGLRPARGELRQSIDSIECACAIGVFETGKADLDGCQEFEAHFDVNSHVRAGVARGFDGGRPIVLSDAHEWEAELRDGHEIGAAVWERVKHLAVEVAQ